jgi:hypothetical protein
MEAVDGREVDNAATTEAFISEAKERPKERFAEACLQPATP